MIKGKKIIIQGDGTSLWILTHNTDFAVGIVGLFGNDKAIGEAFQITSDELLTWNQIYSLFAKELGVELNAIHIPSDFIAKYNIDTGSSLLGDKAHSVIFDNTKIKSLVPEFNPVIKFEEGVKSIVQWYKNNPDWQIINSTINDNIENIINKYEQNL